MATKAKAKKVTAKKSNGTAKPAKQNKTQQVLKMLQRANGVTRPQILEATGWKAVSPQALAAKAGLKIKVDESKTPFVYRVA